MYKYNSLLNSRIIAISQNNQVFRSAYCKQAGKDIAAAADQAANQPAGWQGPRKNSGAGSNPDTIGMIRKNLSSQITFLNRLNV